MEIGTKGGVHCEPRGIIIEKSNGSLHHARRKVVWRREKAGKVDNYYNQNVDSLFLETYNIVIFQGFVEEFERTYICPTYFKYEKAHKAYIGWSLLTCWNYMFKSREGYCGFYNVDDQFVNICQ